MFNHSNRNIFSVYNFDSSFQESDNFAKPNSNSQSRTHVDLTTKPNLLRSKGRNYI